MSTAVSPSRRTPNSRPASDYSQLLKSVQHAGLMKRRYGYYAVKSSLMIMTVAAIVVGIILAVNYDTGSSYYYDDGNEALFAMGMIMLFGTLYVLFPAIGIWAFVEFILILTGSAGYATDDKGLVLR